MISPTLRGSQIINVCNKLGESVESLELAEKVLNGKKVTLNEASIIHNEANRLHLKIVCEDKIEKANNLAIKLGYIEKKVA